MSGKIRSVPMSALRRCSPRPVAPVDVVSRSQCLFIESPSAVMLRLLERPAKS